MKFYLFITGLMLGSFFLGMQLGVAGSHKQLSQEEKIAAYYAHEVATLESPHGIRKKILNGGEDFILVDVRSQEEYEKGHIVGARSIPAYIDKENSAQTDKDRVIESFRELATENPDQKIIVYCYSSSCMSGRKIGHMLAEHDVFVKEMTIGWNEWRYFWQQWNYPHEWENIDPLDYVATGPEPGVFEVPDSYVPEPCDIDNEFGC